MKTSGFTCTLLPGTSDHARDAVTRLSRAKQTADVGGTLSRGDRILYGGLDGGGLLAQTEVLEHERDGEDGTHRVGDVLPRQRRRRPVYRLEHRRPPRIEIAGGRESEAPLQCGAQVRDDIPEQVVGDDDVELRRIL